MTLLTSLLPMKRFIIIGLFIISFSSSYCQKTVKIEFYNKSAGDYDLIIKKILNQNGYKAFINYGNNTKKADYILKYTTESRVQYLHELYKYSLTLLDSNQNIINEVKKSISFFNFGVNEHYQFTKGLGILFKEKFKCKSCSEENEVAYPGMAHFVHKIDSSIYSIKIYANREKSSKKAFFRKSEQYLISFDFYFELRKIKYLNTSGHYVTEYRIMGIIKGSDENTGHKVLLDKPSEFDIEFENEFKE